MVIPRFDAERILVSLVGQTPREGDVIARDREQWRLDPILAPTIEVGNVSGAFSPDFGQGSVLRLILNGDVTFNEPINVRHGRSYFLILDQDETGSRIGTWNSTFYKWPSGNSPVLTTTIGARDIVSFVALEIGGEVILSGVMQPDIR